MKKLFLSIGLLILGSSSYGYYYEKVIKGEYVEVIEKNGGKYHWCKEAETYGCKIYVSFHGNAPAEIKVEAHDERTQQKMHVFVINPGDPGYSTNLQQVADFYGFLLQTQGIKVQ